MNQTEPTAKQTDQNWPRPENQTGLLDLTIGKDEPQLRPVKIIVAAVEDRKVNTAGKEIGIKLVLHCKHPDQNEPIQISSVKYDNGKNLKETGLWINIDNSGQLKARSGISQLLKHYNCSTAKDLVNKELDTATDQRGYLLIKAY